MSNLLHVREKFVRLCGRTDLCANVGDQVVYAIDNGADYFINMGQKILDEMSPVRNPAQLKTITVDAGDYQAVVPRLRTLLHAHMVSADGSRVPLCIKTERQLKDAYPTLFSQTDRSTPQYIAKTRVATEEGSTTINPGSNILSNVWALPYSNSLPTFTDPDAEVAYQVFIAFAQIDANSNGALTFAEVTGYNGNALGVTQQMYDRWNADLNNSLTKAELRTFLQLYADPLAVVHGWGASDAAVDFQDYVDLEGDDSIVVRFSDIPPEDNISSVTIAQWLFSGLLLPFTSSQDQVGALSTHGPLTVEFDLEITGELGDSVYALTITHMGYFDLDTSIFDYFPTGGDGSPGFQTQVHAFGGDGHYRLVIPQEHCFILQMAFRTDVTISNFRILENYSAQVNAPQTGTGVLFMPPTDAARTIEVNGYFYTESLVNNDDESFWTIEDPEALVLAALYCLEVHYRNTQGARDWMDALAQRVRLWDYDHAEQESADFTEIEG